MPNQDLEKYVIECQGCQDSLTIVYSVHTDELNPVPNPKPCNDISTKIDMVKYHLGLLMSTHLKNHPDNDHTDIDDDPCKLMKTVKRVRPP